MAHKRSDIVLSMTLAETFLLLLFLIWLGNVARTPAGVPDDPTPPDIVIARLKAENAKLEEESKRLTSELRRLQLIVDAFRKAIGIAEPITAPEQVDPAVKEAAEAARRGAPKCASENVFARVSVQDGATTFTVVAPERVAQAVGAATGLTVPIGATLRDDVDVERVLQAVSAYADANACRFDYVLTYQTKSDYYDGRERFEKGRLFYAAGISAASKASK
jgi:hypothetical protein